MTIDTTATNEQMIGRVWDVEEIKKIMSRRSYYAAAGDRAGELDALWVRDPQLQEKASYGGNGGWYVGMKEIRRWYVDEYAAARRDVLERWNRSGELAEPCDDPEIGHRMNNALSTPVIELALDGQTAQGRWFSYWQETIGLPNGETEGYWYLESVSADLVKEEDGWRIWHLVCSNDIDTPVGESVEVTPVLQPQEEQRQEKLFGTPTVKFTAHENLFLWEDDYPPIPTPYRSYRDEIGFGPEGHPKRQSRLR